MAGRVRNNRGFTLVELMTCVAVVGLLATMANAQYRKMIARARQSEAKLLLGNIWAIQLAYGVEEGGYSGCLKEIGFEPFEGTRYYTIGFAYQDLHEPKCGPAGTIPCTTYGWSSGTRDCGPVWEGHSRWRATARGNGHQPIPELEDFPGAAEMDTQTFKAMAIGNVSPFSSRPDVWHVSERKQFTHSQNGL